MRPTFVRAGALAGALALAGCNGLQKTTDWLADPKTAQAAANLRSLARAFDCGLVVSGAAASREIVEIVEAGQGVIGTAGRVYAVSAALCEALGGAPGAAPVKVR